MSAPTTNPRCRWFRFGIRTILVLTVLAAIPLSWTFNRVRAQRRFDDALRRASGNVRYDYEQESAPPPGPAWLRNLLGENFFANPTRLYVRYLESDVLDDVLVLVPSTPTITHVEMWEVTDRHLELIARATSVSKLVSHGTFTDAGVAHVAGMPNLSNLALKSPHMTDESLGHLARAQQIEFLGLRGKFTDQGVASLTTLGRLKGLDLRSPEVLELAALEGCHRLETLTVHFVSDSALRHLRGSTSLQEIWLDGDFTDAGVAHLATLPHLSFVWLNSRFITDEGLLSLAECRELTQVSISSDRISAQGVAALQERLPKADIGFGGWIQPHQD